MTWSHSVVDRKKRKQKQKNKLVGNVVIIIIFNSGICKPSIIMLQNNLKRSSFWVVYWYEPDILQLLKHQ